jgi:soluble lytic murein transglycosylase-like protein
MTPGEDSIKKLIASAAWRHQIDPDFVASVVKAESGFNPTALSSKGAQGLMQLMPRTAASLGVENPFDPAANVEGGTKYLRQLLDHYAGDAVKALAAYNAGPQQVEHFGGIPPYRETRAYVARVINDYNFKKLEQQTESRAANK